jgi:hypothetical protein
MGGAQQPAVRVVRPRPLGMTDRIPVFWPGQEASAELKAVDGGALHRHLIAASTPAAGKKRKRAPYHAPMEVRVLCCALGRQAGEGRGGATPGQQLLWGSDRQRQGAARS